MSPTRWIDYAAKIKTICSRFWAALSCSIRATSVLSMRTRCPMSSRKMIYREAQSGRSLGKFVSSSRARSRIAWKIMFASKPQPCHDSCKPSPCCDDQHPGRTEQAEIQLGNSRSKIIGQGIGAIHATTGIERKHEEISLDIDHLL